MSEDAGDQSDEDADESLEETVAGNDNHLISLVPDISAFSVSLLRRNCDFSLSILKSS